ncbi:DNA mismatch repair endonuclease MutL [Thermanaerovibrio acidaminovorans]|uniref:DNA mismatch repair endonuclease MutL n=1 Tax=Thermanaerovibrio acidaminovorans TaxID=81462 RepID=UPI0024906C69|nr:DNA mismatch repair endonuclease MutL [Thermanaerovibrio acidaminovorans]
MELPPEVREKIAAGEVIERPLSVVKELLENSLDAGAKRVSVALSQGGKSSITVEDDGSGIPFEDLPLALTRHATSKIRSVDDLYGIRSLGFRGEALASICAVSRLEIRSRRMDQELGGLIIAEGGEIVLHERVPHPVGTVVKVEELFFNLPARRKFLKSPSAEVRRISQLLQEMSLVNFHRRIQLSSDGRRVFESPGFESPRDAARHLWGCDPKEGFMDHQGLSCHLLWSGSGEGRGSLCFFVNGRRIHDPSLRAAIQGASGTLGGDWVVFLVVPPEEVDVNVHPTKSEVRFKRPRDVFSLVHRGALSVIGGGLGLDGPPGQAIPPARDRWDEPPQAKLPSVEDRMPRLDGPSFGGPQDPAKRPVAGSPLAEMVSQVRYVGEAGRGYLIYESPRGVIFLDPHAAEERITYERIVRGSQGGTQVLAFPVEIPEGLVMSLDGLWGPLEDLGFRFDRDGSGAMRMVGIPQHLSSFDVSPMEWLRWCSSGGDQEEGSGRQVKLLERMASRACRRSMKLGDSLDRDGARRLFEELLRCSVPQACPHGRSTFFVLPWEDIESRLGR